MWTLWPASRSRPTPSARGRRAPRPQRRLALEALEDRVALNNRFVVPLEVTADNVTTFHTLAAALATPGLAGGDFVQVEPGSSPGSISDANLPAVANLTIRGNPSYPARELPAVTTTGALSVDGGQTGLTLYNLHLVLAGGGLTFNVNGTLDASYVVAATAGDALTLHQTTGAVLRGNTLLNQGPGGTSDALIQVNTAAGAQNQITHNTLLSRASLTLLEYAGANPVADRVAHNVFVGNEGGLGPTMLRVGDGVAGLTVQNNTFRDADFAEQALLVSPGAHNINVLDNTFDLPQSGFPALLIFGGPAGTTTGAVVARNVFRTGGRGIEVFVQSGAMNVRVEGNNFLAGAVGVFISSSGAPGSSVSGIDLGGGSQGSAGANNFRAFTATATTASAGAVVLFSGPGGETVQAQNNLFGVADPEAVFFDSNDAAGRPNVVAANALTGNAAFVQALYLRFLRRVGSPGEVAAWAGLLNSGAASPAAVANAIVRSGEALGLLVDGLYRGVLQREPDAGRQGWVNQLLAGATLESVTAQFFGSAEYRDRFAPSDRAFVRSLYARLLGRNPSEAEVEGQLGALAAQGRAGLARLVFLPSAEYRGREVTRLYRDLLRRAPAAAEVASHVGGGADLLSLTAAFAGSAEFQAVG